MTAPRRTPRCRHEASWIIGSFPPFEWCYQCGAFRQLQETPGPTNALHAVSPWRRPTGPTGRNPFDRWQARSKVYRQRLDRKMNGMPQEDR